MCLFVFIVGRQFNLKHLLSAFALELLMQGWLFSQLLISAAAAKWFVLVRVVSGVAKLLVISSAKDFFLSVVIIMGLQTCHFKDTPANYLISLRLSLIVESSNWCALNRTYYSEFTYCTFLILPLWVSNATKNKPST